MNQKYVALGIMTLFGVILYAMSFWATGFAVFSADIDFNSSVDTVKMVEKETSCSVIDPVFQAEVGSDNSVEIEGKGLRYPYKICLFSDGDLTNSMNFTAVDHQLVGKKSVLELGQNQKAEIYDVGIVW